MAPTHLLLHLLLGTFLTLPCHAVKCYVDNQGIPADEAHLIIAEFKVNNVKLDKVFYPDTGV